MVPVSQVVDQHMKIWHNLKGPSHIEIYQINSSWLQCYTYRTFNSYHNIMNFGLVVFELKISFAG